jgi:glucose dehydrogenase
MYTSGNWGVVYALDAATGKSLWTFDPKPITVPVQAPALTEVGAVSWCL